jgi:hypothetical protein
MTEMAKENNNNNNNNNNKYVKRHDKLRAQIHFNIRKEIGVQLDKQHWDEHVLKSVVTTQGGKVTIL